MRRLTRRERAVFVLTLLAGIVYALDQFALAPAWTTWERQHDEIARKQNQMARDRQALQDRRQIERDYRTFVRVAMKEGAPGQLASGEQYGLPLRPEGVGAPGMTALLGEVETLARQSGVKITDIKPRALQGGASRDLSISVALESAWEPLAKFLYAVHQSPQLLEVERASLRRAREDSSTLQGQLVIGEIQPIFINPSDDL